MNRLGIKVLCIAIIINSSLFAQNDYAGIGAAINKNPENNYIIVTNVLTNGPAAKAGLLKDDEITSVDYEKVMNHTLREVTELLRGEAGTSVNLTISRYTPQIALSIKTLTIIREKIATEKFAGCISGDCQNGTGTFVYPDGSSYKGSFVDGKRKGEGILTNDSVSVYSKHWQPTIIFGQMTYKDGIMWKGGINVETLAKVASGNMYDNNGNDINGGRVYYSTNGEFLGKDKNNFEASFTKKSSNTIKKEEPKEIEQNNNVGFEVAFRELQNNIGKTIAGTNSGISNSTSNFTYSTYKIQVNSIAEVHKLLHNVIFKATDAHEKCYQKFKKYGVTSEGIQKCEYAFRSDLEKFNNYAPSITSLYDDILSELRKSSCHKDKVLNEAFSLFRSAAVDIDKECKEIYNMRNRTINQLLALELVQTSNAKAIAADYYSSTVKTWNNKIKFDFESLDEMFKKYDIQVRERCQ